jgi:RNA polymerase sigma factor (sigma-70 family)
MQSAIDEFFSKNPKLVTKAKTFARLTNKEKQSIIKQARSLAARTRISRHQIIEQIAQKTGRAHETVRYTIAAHEKANPGKRLFSKPAGVISPGEAAEIYRLFNQGATIGELTSRFNRNRSSIYRLINLQRARMILARKIDYIASDEFSEEGAREKILAHAPGADNHRSPQIAQPFTLAAESLLPEYMQTLKSVPVLSREREFQLFRRYNYLKYLASVIRGGITLSRVSSARLKQVEDYLAEAEAIKKMIIEGNLRLVLSIAVKHTGVGANLSDLVSEGNFSLMRALEKFDYTKGFRFSSHASWAITKDFARKVPAESALAGKSRTTDFAGVHRDLRRTAAADLGAIDRAHRSLTQVIKNNLNEREQYVIVHHFGLLGPPVKKQKKTLKQMGEDLGVSKERVRQIELVALQKLRHSLSPEQFELLTG